MTDKKPKVNSLAYTELSIQISTLEMKIDKVLELLNKPEVTYSELKYPANLMDVVLDYKHKCDKITPACFDGPCDCTIKTSLSDDEQFTVDFK